MGWMHVLGCCVSCGVGISFNPSRVPALRIEGERQPLCSACFHRWNDIHRTAKGLQPLPLHPEAYAPTEVQ